MKCVLYSHRRGTQKVPYALQIEISEAIGATSINIRKGTASALRDAVQLRLLQKGWSSPMPVSAESGMTITAMKRGVGLCLQTGNMARMYADLLKLQKLFEDKVISAGVMIVPSQPVAKAMGDNIAHASRLERELEIFGKVIRMPILLFAME